jgi:uncharacterized protein YbjT (DUF2867 family)
LPALYFPLSSNAARVRGLIRSAADAAAVRKHGAAEIAIGDLSDRASISAALKGVDSIFYIASAFLRDEADVGKGMVNAAKQAGVRRLVFSSVIHPILTALENHGAKGPVEEAILESGMEYTLLHPTMFFQNYAGSWPTILKTGALAEPWSNETHFSRVDYRDVAEVAAIALTEDRLKYGTFELCAEGSLNRRGVAALLGDVLRRPIEAVKQSQNEAASAPDDPAESAQGAALKRMFDWYDHHALLGNALTLRAILGREPRTLRAYFE